jgi:hypothetical protein
MTHTHTLADWLAMICVAASGYGALSAVYFLLVDADARDFDPRPAVRRALETDRLRPAWQAAVNAGHDLDRLLATTQRATGLLLRDAAVWVAAILSLLFPATGGTR